MQCSPKYTMREKCHTIPDPQEDYKNSKLTLYFSQGLIYPKRLKFKCDSIPFFAHDCVAPLT